MTINLGVLRPHPQGGKLTLVALHPGVADEATREAMGWDPEEAEEPGITDPTMERELEALRSLRARTEASRKEA